MVFIVDGYCYSIICFDLKNKEESIDCLQSNPDATHKFSIRSYTSTYKTSVATPKISVHPKPFQDIFRLS